ncbi:MAG TPA: hemolysin family protein, partial [Gaiellaceae bacterium]|nr:hemolysin family protein [Gaiellaceae bacterium]
VDSVGAERDVLSEAELRMLVSRSTAQGEIEEEEQEMIDKVFVFGDKDAASVMVARPDVVSISVEMPPEDAVAAVLESPYTRFPVYRETLDDIVGVLHVRDLFAAMHERGLDNVHLNQLLRDAYIVPETKDLASLLQDFRRTSNHFAVVVDEYGAMVGICTLEDLIEEIVGEIEDEFDVAEEPIVQIDEDSYRVDGMFPIDEFNDRFGTDLPDDDYHTVAGFVFGQLGRAPEPGDDVTHEGLRFDVLDVEGNRIERLAATFLKRPERRREAEELLDPEDDEVE